MAKKKKTKQVNWKDVAVKFNRDMDRGLVDLYNMKDDVFRGEITHNELIEQLFSICAKFNTAFQNFEESSWGD